MGPSLIPHAKLLAYKGHIYIIKVLNYKGLSSKAEAERNGEFFMLSMSTRESI